MKNICTHETSAALKAAGFPQPEPEAGQVWYSELEGACRVLDTDFESITLWAESLGEVLHVPHGIKHWTHVFAPTAADIQAELPYLVCAKFPHATHWEAWDYMAGTRAGLWSNANPADACAAAWLELKKQVAKSG